MATHPNLTRETDQNDARAHHIRRGVVFLGHGAERTGPPIVLGHLLGGLARTRPWDLSVVVARSGPMLDVYRAAGAHVAAVGSAREPLEPLAAALRHARLDPVARRLQDARRRRAVASVRHHDLVYVNAATPPTAALLRALDAPPSTPVVVHVHELDVGLRGTLSDADRRFLLDRATHVVAASNTVAELLVAGHGLDPQHVTTCAEFVDVSALRPASPAAARARLGIPADAEVVGSVGLPDWRKDPEHLLRAVAPLAERAGGAPWVVWIGGDPASTDGQHLADEARRLHLTDRFVHLGHQDDPSSLLDAFDVFALPAREDALPLAALEAAGTGLPLVCFRTGGVAELCDAGGGIAVAYPDTTAFGRAIADLLDDESRRATVGAAARDLVRAHHDVGPGTARIAEVLDPMLADPA